MGGGGEGEGEGVRVRVDGDNRRIFDCVWNFSFRDVFGKYFFSWVPWFFFWFFFGGGNGGTGADWV